MAFVVSKPNFPLERRLQLAGEEIFFPMQMGNNWAKIRIGIRWCAYAQSGVGTAAVVPFEGSSRIGFGICNGLQGFFHPSPVDVIMVTPNRHTAGVGGIMTIVTNQTPFVLNSTGGQGTYWKRGGLTTGVGSSNSIGVWYLNQQPTDTNNRMGVAYLDIDRSAYPTFNTVLYMPTVTQSVTQPNWTLPVFYAQLGNTGIPTNTTAVAVGSQGGLNITYDGVNVFDTVCIFSNHTGNFVLEIATLAACRYL